VQKLLAPISILLQIGQVVYRFGGFLASDSHHNEEYKFTDMSSPATTANRVLTQYWDGQLPIDPASLAQKMGVTVKPIRGADYSGKAYQDHNTCYIDYNDSESALRQRFTIAHELGHHLLNHTDATHQFRDSPKDFALNVVSPVETEANKFAAELLMPKFAVEHFILNKGISSIPKLANLFSVSTVAMHYRLKNLGLL